MRKFLLSSMVAAFALAGAAQAQNIPGLNPTQPAPTTPVKTGKKITVQELGEMLENIGYEPKPFKNDQGDVIGYDVTYTSDSWTLYASFSISPSGNFIWITGSIATVDKLDEVSKEALLAMLEESFNLGPAHVTYNSKTKKLAIGYAMANGTMTPAQLRNGLNVFTGAVKQAVNTWTAELKKAKEGKTSPTPSPSPAPTGTGGGSKVEPTFP